MLILTRREGETLILTLPDGRTVEVRVLEAGGAVKLGLKAPREVEIWRGELEAGRKAAGSG